MSASRVTNTLAWLVQAGVDGMALEQLVPELYARLRADGLALDRWWLGLPAVHPLVAGVAYLCALDEPLVVRQLPLSRLELVRSEPQVLLDALGRGHSRFRPGEHPRGHDGMAEALWDDRYTEVLVAGARCPAGQQATIFMTWATRRSGGFDEGDLSALLSLIPTLNLVIRASASRTLAEIVATTYLGPRTGPRVIAGEIHRGDGEKREAAIWFSDLRGFSNLSSSLPPKTVLRLLDDAFEAQVEAVTAGGGEVLKFMGDGLLAMFDGDGSARGACRAALAAARDLPTRIAACNQRRQDDGEPLIRYGLALHYGTCMFGNIGAPERLDFTVIGPAVNLCARLEPLTSQLDVRAVASALFMRHADEEWPHAGTFTLKGVGECDVHVVPDGSAEAESA